MYDSKPTYKYLKTFKVEPTAHIFDLQIAHYLIQPETKHTLDWIVLSYLSATLKNSGLQIQDAAIERINSFVQLYPLLLKDLQENQLYDLFENVEMPLVPVLADTMPPMEWDKMFILRPSEFGLTMFSMKQ